MKNISLQRLIILMTYFSCRFSLAIDCDNSDAACLRQHYQQPPQLWTAPHIDAGIAWQELAPITPYSSPLNAQEQLGAALFHEARLSQDGSTACASCHLASYGFADNHRVSTGILGRQGRRNSISLLHLSQPQSAYFWDGRAHTLEQQVLMPISDPNEMNLLLPLAPQRLRAAGYENQFQQTFAQSISNQTIATALASYLRTLRPQPTRFDAFLSGDAQALSDSEIRGLHLFRSKARCMNCHFGAYLTDGKLHNLNQAFAGRKWQDLGQYEHSGKLADWGKFKTPSLRNLSASKPWFHHGLFVNLRGVVAIYNSGMDFIPAPNAAPEAYENRLDPLIQPLHLSKQEQEDLTHFLESL